MKSKIYKSLILASAIAFVNCGDDSSESISGAASNGDTPVLSSSSVEGEASVGTSSSGVSEGAGTSANGSAESSSNASASGDADASGANASNAAGANSSDSNAAGTSDASASGDAVASSSAGASSETPSGAADASSSSGDASAASSDAGVAVDPASSAAEAVAEVKVFLADAADESDGVAHTYIENTGYDGKGILAYPNQLSSEPGVKHRIVVWGPGGDTEPGAYGGMIHRLASHGFVVIAISISPGTGDNMIAAIDWMEKKNEDPSDPLYGKLDFTKVGCAGHSMGGLESEQAAIKDSRVNTIVLNNSGDKQHKAMSEISKEKTMLNIYGEAGIERFNARADYENEGVVGGACLIQMVGGPQGGEGGWGHGSASWSGIAGTIAWMRWQLGGEDRKADFVGTSGKYINGPIIGAQGNWDGQCKNF